jgi:hypothetical protein
MGFRVQHLLTSGIHIQDMNGDITVFDVVRIIKAEEWPSERKIMVTWELGRIVEGTWQTATSRHSGCRTYTANSYDVLMDQEDLPVAIYSEMATGGVIGAGTQQPY